MTDDLLCLRLDPEPEWMHHRCDRCDLPGVLCGALTDEGYAHCCSDCTHTLGEAS